MTHTLSLFRGFLTMAALTVMLPAFQASAQPAGETETPPARPGSDRLTVRPMLGVQTMWFNGKYPASDHLFTIGSEDAPLGGGFKGPSNAVHLELELIPNSESIIRIPFSADAFFLKGKTTFAGSSIGALDPQRIYFRHTANIYSLGTGIRAAFFKSPNLYVSAEGRFNYITSTELYSRVFYSRTDSTASELTLTPDPNDHIRLGAYVKVGTQVEFFEPLLLDFSVGYGALNLFGKETDPDKLRNLLVIEPQVQKRFKATEETTLGYIGVAFSVIWRL